MPDTQCSQIFLGRQPILGREQQLLAYELLFRGGPVVSGGQTGIEDPGQATATVIANTFAGMSADETLGPYRGYINVDQQFLFSDLIEVLPPALVVLEILESVQPTPEVVARCRELRGKGFTLAIDDVVDVGEAYRPLFELAEIIKVDILDVDAGRLAALVGQLKPFGKKLLAEKVESAEQVEQCKRLGFELFQGYYFAKPAIIVGKKLEPSQISLLPLAATRGRLLERLAERLQPHSREFADQGFMVGIMSLMPALLDVSMEETLAQLPVAQRVRQALLDQGGLLGQMLQLALATEQTDPEVLEDALRRVPGISVEFLEDCLRQAFYWANNLGREKTDDV